MKHSSYLLQRKSDLQKAWGIVHEDRVETPKGPIFLMDGPTPMGEDPECQEIATRCAWFIPVNDKGRERFIGRTVHFPIYPEKSNGLFIVNSQALNREHRKKEAIRDAMDLLEKLGDG